MKKKTKKKQKKEKKEHKKSGEVKNEEEFVMATDRSNWFAVCRERSLGRRFENDCCKTVVADKSRV